MSEWCLVTLILSDMLLNLSSNLYWGMVWGWDDGNRGSIPRVHALSPVTCPELAVIDWATEGKAPWGVHGVYCLKLQLSHPGTFRFQFQKFPSSRSLQSFLLSPSTPPSTEHQTFNSRPYMHRVTCAGLSKLTLLVLSSTTRKSWSPSTSVV